MHVSDVAPKGFDAACSMHEADLCISETGTAMLEEETLITLARAQTGLGVLAAAGKGLASCSGLRSGQAGSCLRSDREPRHVEASVRAVHPLGSPNKQSCCMQLLRAMTPPSWSIMLLVFLVAACSLPHLCRGSAADPPLEDADGWRLGRATFYGGPASFTDVTTALQCCMALAGGTLVLAPACMHREGTDEGGRMQAFAARGAGSFGNLAFGSCGFYQQDVGEPITDSSIPYAWDAVAALATTDADYPGALSVSQQ